MNDKNYRYVARVTPPAFDPQRFIEAMQEQGSVDLIVTIEAPDRATAIQLLTESSENYDTASYFSDPDTWQKALARGIAV